MRKSCIPNIFTFINLSCGILSILSVINDNYLLAAIFILVAGFVDRYDGRVARYLQVSSDLGKELDSLADLVSFGVAPSILIYFSCGLNQTNPVLALIGFALLLAFPICGAFRLARFNTVQFDGSFRGIPITIAGCFMAALDLILRLAKVSVQGSAVTYIMLILMIAGAYLMVSNIKLKKV